MPMELQFLYVELGGDDQQCEDGRWLAKMKSTGLKVIQLNSSNRITTGEVDAIKKRKFLIE